MARQTASVEAAAFAQRLRALREQMGYETGAEFARAIGVEPPAYRKWERGEAEPSIAYLCKIQKLTMVSLDFLVAGSVPLVSHSETRKAS